MQAVAFLLALASVTLFVLWLSDMADRVLYWAGRKLGKIPVCSSGHCYCPDTCEHLAGGSDE